MPKTTRKVYIFWILLSLLVGAVSALLSMEGIRSFNEQTQQPSLTPPPWVFGLVWSILYILMGIGAARVFLTESSRERSMGLNLFATQLVVNFFWSLIFFNARAYGLAFIWLLLLLGLVIGMTLYFLKTDKLAGYLQIPYLIWLIFAAWLTYSVWMLNG